MKDSFAFTELVDQRNVRNKWMCSFDVSSLFTNVPLLEIVEFVVKYVRDNFPNFPLNPDLLKDLLLMCTENVQFTFNNELYRQSDGIMMGSCLGPILANIFMAKLEMEHEHIIDSLDFYVRYVDDILIFVRNRRECEQLLTVFNSWHGNIKFTIEHENNDAIPFLDVMLARRQDGTLMRSVYRKPTWLPLYIHYHSYAPMKYKVGLIKTLFHRANSL